MHIAGTAADAWAQIRRQRPVAVVLDVGLPDGDGLDLCRRLRAAGDDTPVLFATARDEDVDRILGLELGGDDYLVKPFNPRELVARVRAVLRRGTGAAPVGCWRPAGCGSTNRAAARGSSRWTARADARRARNLAHRNGVRPARVPDPAAGPGLRAGQPAERRVGLRSAAGERTVDVHIAALRAKLGEASPIRTVRGVGYGVDRA